MEHTESWHVESIEVSPGLREMEEAQRVLLAIAGLGCASCVNRVRNAILETPGVVQVELALPDTVARVWYHEESTRLEDLLAAVVRAGEGTHHTYLAVPLEPWVPDNPRVQEIDRQGEGTPSADPGTASGPMKEGRQGPSTIPSGTDTLTRPRKSPAR